MFYISECFLNDQECQEGVHSGKVRWTSIRASQRRSKSRPAVRCRKEPRHYFAAAALCWGSRPGQATHTPWGTGKDDLQPQVHLKNYISGWEVAWFWIWGCNKPIISCDKFKLQHSHRCLAFSVNDSNILTGPPPQFVWSSTCFCEMFQKFVKLWKVVAEIAKKLFQLLKMSHRAERRTCVDSYSMWSFVGVDLSCGRLVGGTRISFCL